MLVIIKHHKVLKSENFKKNDANKAINQKVN